MQEADAEMSVVGVAFRGGVRALEVEERFPELRAVMLGFGLVTGRKNQHLLYNFIFIFCLHPVELTRSSTTV